jgi:hypothetical protein
MSAATERQSDKNSDAADLIERLSTPSAEGRSVAPYWLVERAAYTPRRYWTMHPHQANTWETDPAKAIRYTTREEAMRVVMMLPEECEACEHMDCRAPGPVLDKPAQIGATRFGVGVSWSTVIDRAQREYEYRTGQDADAANLLATVASSATGPINARRYEWLRSHDKYEYPAMHGFAQVLIFQPTGEMMTDQYKRLSGEALDAAIDAAMKVNDVRG